MRWSRCGGSAGGGWRLCWGCAFELVPAMLRAAAAGRASSVRTSASYFVADDFILFTASRVAPTPAATSVKTLPTFALIAASMRAPTVSSSAGTQFCRMRASVPSSSLGTSTLAAL